MGTQVPAPCADTIGLSSGTKVTPIAYVIVTIGDTVRKGDKHVNSSVLHIPLTKVYNNHNVNPEVVLHLNPTIFHVFLPKTRFGLQRCELSPNRLTKDERERGRKIEYEHLMQENGWTRAELARQLGVSRVWVTTVLNKSP